MKEKIFNSTIMRFALVGVANTVFGTAIMFTFYNLLGFNYWISSASNYIFGSILSFFLNKYFTFKSKDNSLSSVLRFAINIAICYFVAYGVAKPLVRFIFSAGSTSVQDNFSMLAGMCIFVILNYFGQRLFVFKNKAEK